MITISKWWCITRKFVVLFQDSESRSECFTLSNGRKQHFSILIYQLSKKALMWLLHMEQTDSCHIQHVRNGCELLHYSADGFCAETRTLYELLGCYYLGCTCQLFRDVKMLGGDTLSERYEQTLARIEQISRQATMSKFNRNVSLTKQRLWNKNPNY
jgi:hypothetical protein